MYHVSTQGVDECIINAIIMILIIILLLLLLYVIHYNYYWVVQSPMSKHHVIQNVLDRLTIKIKIEKVSVCVKLYSVSH